MISIVMLQVKKRGTKITEGWSQHVQNSTGYRAPLQDGCYDFFFFFFWKKESESISWNTRIGPISSAWSLPHFILSMKCELGTCFARDWKRRKQRWAARIIRSLKDWDIQHSWIQSLTTTETDRLWSSEKDKVKKQERNEHRILYKICLKTRSIY